MNPIRFGSQTPVLAFTTENKNKLREATQYVNKINAQDRIDIVGLGIDVDETGKTFQANADLKVKAGAEKLLNNPDLLIEGKRPTAVIGEDSGLIIDALGGQTVNGMQFDSEFPGIKANRWLDHFGAILRKTVGLEPLPTGEKSSDADRNQAILKLMEGKENRNAKYVAAISYIDLKKPNEIKHFVGEMPLKVIPSYEQPRGDKGFAYDSIMFVADSAKPQLHNKTVGELDPDQKNEISHRGRALQALSQAIH